MPLSHTIKAKIHDYLSEEGLRFIDETLEKPVDIEANYPFHSRLMPTPANGWFRLSERGFSTRTGTWWQVIARMVASEYHAHAENNKVVRGRIRGAALSAITDMLSSMEGPHPRRVPNRRADIDLVLAVQAPDGQGNTERSDLFIIRHDRTEMHFEIKTPRPNKASSMEMKRRILTITAMGYDRHVEAYAGSAYNPFGEGNPYTETHAKQFLDYGADFMVGRAFWTKIGDDQTYSELLEIAGEVGAELDTYLAGRLS